MITVKSLKYLLSQFPDDTLVGINGDEEVSHILDARLAHRVVLITPSSEEMHENLWDADSDSCPPINLQR